MKNQIKIERLPHPEHAGDWHDAPLRWVVSGPDSEIQKFSTRKHAGQYASARRHSANQTEAILSFIAS